MAMQQLQVLRQILEHEVAWYTESPNDTENIWAYFITSNKNAKITGQDWVSWVFDHKDEAVPLIKEMFANAFHQKEITVSCRSGMGGHVHYISIIGKR